MTVLLIVYVSISAIIFQLYDWVKTIDPEINPTIMQRLQISVFWPIYFPPALVATYKILKDRGQL